MQMQIDKDIPPPKPPIAYHQYPLDSMEVGDSFWVPDPTGDLAHRVQCQLSYRKRRAGDPRTFTSRRESSGLRVWRIA